MNRRPLSIKTIVAIGIGAAVFLILGRFACIPTGIPNTELQTAYAFLGLMAVIYGPFAGMMIGFIGHMLKDLTAYGSPWMSWIIASAVVGLIIGIAQRRMDIEEGAMGIKKIIYFNVYQVIANVIAWVVVAPSLDILIYAEPMNKVYIQGAVASISNSLTVGVLGTFLLIAYSKTRIQKGTLVEED
nr:ECF-type riboflavin transporter substrate-binding protein [uncultured Cellulosilyticum sp.]